MSALTVPGSSGLLHDPSRIPLGAGTNLEGGMDFETLQALSASLGNQISQPGTPLGQKPELPGIAAALAGLAGNLAPHVTGVLGGQGQLGGYTSHASYPPTTVQQRGLEEQSNLTTPTSAREGPPTLPSIRTIGTDSHLSDIRGSPTLGGLRHYGAQGVARSYDGSNPSATSAQSVIGATYSGADVRSPFTTMPTSSPVSKVPHPPSYYGKQDAPFESTGKPQSLRSPTTGTTVLSPVLNPILASMTPPSGNYLLSGLPGGSSIGPSYASSTSSYNYPAGPYYTPQSHAGDSLQFGRDIERPKSQTRRMSTAGLSSRRNGYGTEHDIPFGADDDREEPLHFFGEDGEGFRYGPGRKRKKSFVDGLGREFSLEQRNEGLERAKEQAKKRRKPGEVAIVNDPRLKRIPPGVMEKYLGHVVYTGARSASPTSHRAADLKLFLLPQFTSADDYCLIEVRVPAELLTFRGNLALRKNAAWGTSVYTDDSDVVTMLVHDGWYKPIDAPEVPVPPLPVPVPEKETFIKVEATE
ncbi:hypothetical protein HK097_010620, partial [Rhizophlyctis rosea]